MGTQHMPTPYKVMGMGHSVYVGVVEKKLGRTLVCELLADRLDTPKERARLIATAEFIVRACNAHDELVRELNQTIADMQGICSLTDDDVLAEIAVQVADRLAVVVGRRPKEAVEA